MVYAFLALCAVTLGAFYAIIRLQEAHAAERRELLATRIANPEINFAMPDIQRPRPEPPRDATELAHIGQIIPGDFLDEDEQ